MGYLHGIQKLVSRGAGNSAQGRRFACWLASNRPVSNSTLLTLPLDPLMTLLSHFM